MGWGAALQSGSALGASFINRETAKDIRRKEEQKQKKFAQNAIQWKVADAIKAGIHPLYALGAETVSFQPTGVGSADMAFGKGIADAGQHLGRAVDQMLDTHQKEMRKVQLAGAKEDLRKKGYEADILKRERDALDSPSMPSFGDDPVDKWYGILGQSKGLSKGTGSRAEMVTGQEGAEMVRPQIPYSGSLGRQIGTAPLEMGSIDKDGFLFFTPNQQMTEMMEDNLDFKMRYYGMKIKDYYKGFRAAFSGPSGEAGKKWMAEWRKVLPKAPPGHYWQYHTARGQFKLTPEKEYKRRGRRFRWDDRQRGKRPDWNKLTY